MPPNSEPSPADYGLDEEVMKYFSSRVHTFEMLPYLLGWLSFIGLLLLLPPFDFISKYQYAWPIILLYFLPGGLSGWVVSNLREDYLEYSKRRHRLYQNWQDYLAAHSQWQRVHFKEYEEERRRQALLRKDRAEKARRQLGWWRALNGKQFEKQLAGLLRELGYDVTLTPYSGDGGIDILVRDGAKHIIVQCKAHSNYISPGVVRELYGTMIHEKADEGWLVTTSGFYSGARAFARDKPIKLITITELLKRLSTEGR